MGSFGKYPKRSAGMGSSDRELSNAQRVDLMLSAGEFSITLFGDFGLSENMSDNPSGLTAALKFIVTQ
jgi:hypothetical protein